VVSDDEIATDSSGDDFELFPVAGSEDCQAPSCPPPGGPGRCAWPDCAVQLNRDGDDESMADWSGESMA
jgi:hypothetical protein